MHEMLPSAAGVRTWAGLLMSLGLGVVLGMRHAGSISQELETTSAVFDAEAEVLLASCSNPVFMNLGYASQLKDDPDYYDYNDEFYASEESLARQFGSFAQLSNKDKFVVDVGFGYADQDLLFVKEFGVNQIAGINISPVNVRVATMRVAKRGYSDRIKLHVGDAIDMSSANIIAGSVDKVLALETSHHFTTRDTFFNEVMRVLKPGGMIALADEIAQDEATASKLQGLCNTFFVERGTRTNGNLGLADNWYDAHEYEQRLIRAGFVNITILDITDHIVRFKPNTKVTRYGAEYMSMIFATAIKPV